MNHKDVLLLSGEEIYSLLKGREWDLIEEVKTAYVAHAIGDSYLPHSTFVRFPDSNINRIIALPAYIGGRIDAVGLKWIASFPENVSIGLERASATIILNSTDTGLPLAIMEGSIISAKRTAASAALAAQLLQEDREYSSVGLIGCGLINYEILRFLSSTQPAMRSLYLYDLDLERLEQFKRKCSEQHKGLKIVSKRSREEVFENASLISFATTAVKPYVNDLSCCRPRSIILNISLRDLYPEIILSSKNVVDDPDHVCRAETSLDLAQQSIGSRDFIDCSIGEIIMRKSHAPDSSEKNVIFSPFGLGVLDMALAHLVFRLASEHEKGTIISDFIGKQWYDRD